VRCVDEALRVLRLLQELADLGGILVFDVDDAELVRERQRLTDARDRGPRTRSMCESSIWRKSMR